LEPVFQVILENAVRLCEASFGMLSRLYADAKFTTCIAKHATKLDVPWIGRMQECEKSPGSRKRLLQQLKRLGESLLAQYRHAGNMPRRAAPGSGQIP
jgi:hypothetical protein